MSATPENLEIIGIPRGFSKPASVLAELREYAASAGGWVQMLDAAHVAGEAHLQSAIVHARRAFAQGTNTTNTIEMEFLLYASGERQISKAIQVTGARPGRPAVIVFGGGVNGDAAVGAHGWIRDDRITRADRSKLRAVGYAADEIRSAGTPEDLVLERVARVDLLR